MTNLLSYNYDYRTQRPEDKEKEVNVYSHASVCRFSYGKGTTYSFFSETFYQYLKYIRLFSLIILINISFWYVFSFSLPKFADYDLTNSQFRKS